jgi:two-component system, OmpR family, sensor kinase
VTVGAVAEDGQVRITVHDGGPGLTPDLAAEAFDRFTRGDSSRTHALGGAGLGRRW